MSASLIVMIPLVLLGLVTALCFVGCVFQSGGLDLQGPYLDNVTSDPNLVACWPLDDQADIPDNPDGATAADISKNKLNGTYKGAANSVKVQQEGIVPGDVPSSGPPNTCAFFNGGRVSVPFAGALNPAKFTVEAWVKPQWAAGDTAVRGVVLSLNTMNAGYALFVQNNAWTAGVGTGAGNTFATVSLPVIFENGAPVPTYVAVTLDGNGTLTLFVGPVNGILTNTSMTISGTFVPENSMTTETPLFIGIGRPDLPAGMNPLNGFVQDVAVYNDALSTTAITNRFNIGKGG